MSAAQLMCCPGPDSCSGHEVTRYEHHFATQNIYLPSRNPPSQSIPTSERNLLQLNTSSVSPTFLLIHLEQRHTQGTIPMLSRKFVVCPNATTAGESVVSQAGRASHGSVYPGTKSQWSEGTGCQHKAIHPLQGIGVAVMTEGERGS